MKYHGQVNIKSKLPVISQHPYTLGSSLQIEAVTLALASV